MEEVEELLGEIIQKWDLQQVDSIPSSVLAHLKIIYCELSRYLDDPEDGDVSWLINILASSLLSAL